MPNWSAKGFQVKNEPRKFTCLIMQHVFACELSENASECEIGILRGFKG